MTELTKEEIVAAAKAAAAEKRAKANEGLPPVALVYLIDNTVVDILRTDERLAAIMLSNPTIMDYHDTPDLRSLGIAVGSTYDTNSGSFTLPDDEE